MSLLSSKKVIPPMGNSYHVAFLVCSNFPLNLKGDAHFYLTTFDYSFANWSSFFDHLRDIPLEAIRMWPGWN